MEKSDNVTTIFELHESQPEPIKRLIGPMKYALRLKNEGIISAHGFSVVILKPYSIYRVNAEIWRDSHNFFKPLFWRF